MVELHTCDTYYTYLLKFSPKLGGDGRRSSSSLLKPKVVQETVSDDGREEEGEGSCVKGQHVEQLESVRNDEAKG